MVAGACSRRVGPCGRQEVFPAGRPLRVDTPPPAPSEDPVRLPPPARLTLPLALGAYFVGLVLTAIAVAQMVEDGAGIDSMDGVETFVSSLPLFLSLAGGALVIPALGGLSPASALRLDRFRWYDVPAGLVGGAVAQLALIPIYAPVLRFVDDDVSTAARQLTDRFSDSEIWLLVLMVVVVAPVCEELFFRGLVQGGLERSLPTVPALLLSAVIFGAVHFQLLQFLGLGLFGLVLAVALNRTGRLSVTIFLHMGFNLMGVAGLLAERF